MIKRDLHVVLGAGPLGRQVAAELAGRAAPRLRPTPAMLLRIIGLFQPAAAESIEIGYACSAPLQLSADAWNAAFPERATDLDAALLATLAWWRAAASRASATLSGDVK